MDVFRTGDSTNITRTLALDALRLDNEIQPRVELNRFTVQDYAEQKTLGVQFPPVVVFEDGNDLWLADGYHRAAAAKKAGRNEIEAQIRPGTKDDAMRYACSANTKHGLRMNNADKRRVTDRIIQLEQAKPEEAQLAQREIAALCGVTQAFVSKRKAALFPAQPCNSAVMRTSGNAACARDNGYHQPMPGEETATATPDAVAVPDVDDYGVPAVLTDNALMENEPVTGEVPSDMAARIVKSVMRCLHPFKAMPLECIETALTEAVEEIRRRILEAGN